MNLAPTLIALGVLFLLGLAADQIGRRTRLPRVTLLLGCGLLVGKPGFDLIPTEIEAWYPFLSITALTMVAFLLGGALSAKTLRAHGREILTISVSIVGLTLFVVALGLWLLGMVPGLALILGAIATATAPAATQDVIRQSGVTGGFADTLKGIVAIDDAWGLIVFSLIVVGVHQMDGNGDATMIIGAARDIGGSIILGAAIGLPAAYLTGRLSAGEPLRVEALGLVFLTAGLAVWLDLSFLISGMTAGAVIVNRARHHTRAFHEIEHIQWPFMILFFILAGASLSIEAPVWFGIIGLSYIVLRSISRVAGGWIGARLSGAPAPLRPWYGVALLPQAGVAIGMALVVADQFPDWAEPVMALTVGTTVVFEILGPAATLYALNRVRLIRE